MRRPVIMFLLGIAALAATAPSASAICEVVPFDRVIHQSDVVWWGKVTGTKTVIIPGATVQRFNWPSPRPERGTALIVQLQQVLKGEGSPGQSRPVITPSCGFVSLGPQPEMKQYVGQYRLFIGGSRGSFLVTTAVIYNQAGLSQQQQYSRALADLGLHAVPTSEPAIQPPGSQRGSAGYSWWPWGVPIILLVLVIAAASVLRPAAVPTDDRG